MMALRECRRKLLRAVGFIVDQFGPLIVFYAFDLTLGLKAAIAASVAFVAGDAIRRYAQGLAFSRIYKMSVAVTIVFGAIDLSVRTPIMLAYESVISNAAFGLFFVAASRGERPMFQDLAERQEGHALPARPDVAFFFRVLALIWAASFFLKAALYLWIAGRYPLAQAIAIRAVVGPVSLGVMILLSIRGRQLFRLFRKLGWLPAAEPNP